MAQPDFVKAFRQRLVRNGFENIIIHDNFDGTYYVNVIDRYGTLFIRPKMTELQIRNTPRLVWFD